ncbi:hypothetical protein AC1031_019885 [Aphanomyces cochlioides]|nr:hypothetical protein AC1031_019885 [Aphanomyces cochlioides]
MYAPMLPSYDLLDEFPAHAIGATCALLLLLTALLRTSWLSVIRSTDKQDRWDVTAGPMGVFVHPQNSTVVQAIFPSLQSGSWGHFCSELRIDGSDALCGNLATVSSYLLVLTVLFCFASQMILWRSTGKIKCQMLLGAAIAFSMTSIGIVITILLWLHVINAFAELLLTKLTFVSDDISIDSISFKCSAIGATCLEATSSFYCLLASAIVFVGLSFSFVQFAIRNVLHRENKRYLYEEIH